jgi:prepilin-type N-terminal cleavage/methylation domain-containing protein
MYRRNFKRAFTLIELLTVMAIITLLIGILTPALGAARDRARTTAIKAQLNAMEVGLESFHGDAGFYPPSNAYLMARDPTNPQGDLATPGWEVQGGTSVLQGAHLLVDALVGRDFLGYDPKAAVPGSGPNNYNRWEATNDRRQPYIKVDGVSTTSANDLPQDGSGTIGAPPNGTTNLGDSLPKIDGLICRVFKDRFGWPILYYRANPSANANTPIITVNGLVPPPNPNFGNGVFDGLDNEVFTSYAGNKHRIADANLPIAGIGNLSGVETLDQITGTGRFAEFIRSFRATTYDVTITTNISIPRPVKADSAILLSPGKDGIYGNLDDVANFPVLSPDR